jgi:AcrR family transcriptional regulator
MDRETAQAQALDAAERLFYQRGIQAVGMDDIRAESGVSLKRLYQLFPAKEQLVTAFLRRRDIRWRGRLATHVDTHTDPERRLLAVFDWLYLWFSEPQYRGCAWINAFGELGAISPAVAEEVRTHKRAFKQYVDDLVTEAGLPAHLADHLRLLAEGAMTTAAISGSAEPARQAGTAAGAIIQHARQNRHTEAPQPSRT